MVDKILKTVGSILVLTFVVSVIAMFNSNVAQATNNLWRCSNCGGQIQTSSSSKPNAGTCPHSSRGHDWYLVR